MSGVNWELGIPMTGPAASGGRDGPRSVVPFSWRHVGVTGSGQLTFRVVAGRLECVGVRVGDPGGAAAVESGNSPEPPLIATLFRSLSMGSIIAASARLVSEQVDMATQARRAFEDAPEGVLEMPDGTYRRAAAAELLVALRATHLRIERPRHRVGRPPVYGEAHYREVARIYAEAWSNGDRSPTKAVATEWTVVRSTAAKWVMTARRLGFLGPTTPRRAGQIRPAPL